MDKQDYKIGESLGKKWPEFMKRAGILQNEVMTSENTRLREGLIDYTSKQARMATVHSREDIILMVSYMQTLIMTMQRIFYVLVLIVVITGFIAFK